MTYDPREEKLPKWAQELLSETRRNADLRWPTEQESEPFVTFDTNGWTNGEYAKSTRLWKAVGGFHGLSVEAADFDQNGYVRSAGGGFGNRPNGRYYETERDALVAAWWKEARACALALHQIADRVRASEK